MRQPRLASWWLTTAARRGAAGRRLREAERLEWRLSDLVNEAYGLAPDEVSLMWATAPPRMPLVPEAEALEQGEDEAAE